jgi:hypothetical protein
VIKEAPAIHPDDFEAYLKALCVDPKKFKNLIAAMAGEYRKACAAKEARIEFCEFPIVPAALR